MARVIVFAENLYEDHPDHGAGLGQDFQLASTGLC